MAPHLSSVPGERTLQKYVMAYFSMVAFLGVVAVGLQLWGYSALGSTATSAQMSAFLRSHGWPVVRWALAIGFSLTMLAFPVLAWRQRLQLTEVGGLRGRWVLAGVLLAGFAIPMMAWVGIAAHLATIGWLLTLKPDPHPTSRAEGGSFG